MYFLEIQILQRTQKSVSVKPFPKEAGQKSKTPAACQRPKSVLPKIPIRMEMEGPVWFQYHLLVLKERIAHFRSDSNSKIKICGGFFYQKAGQNNAIPATCQIPKSTLHLIALSLSPMIQMWTRRVPWRGRVQLAKTTFDSNNCFFLYEKKEKQFLIMMLLFL